MPLLQKIFVVNLDAIKITKLMHSKIVHTTFESRSMCWSEWRPRHGPIGLSWAGCLASDLVLMGLQWHVDLDRLIAECPVLGQWNRPYDQKWWETQSATDCESRTLKVGLSSGVCCSRSQGWLDIHAVSLPQCPCKQLRITRAGLLGERSYSRPLTVGSPWAKLRSGQETAAAAAAATCAQEA